MGDRSETRDQPAVFNPDLETLDGLFCQLKL